MNQTRDYLIPDYYPDFHCKMGACRTACCEGWPVSVSMKDYFELLGMDCSPELRQKLDCALHLSLHPSPEAYAQILPRYDGQCPLRMEDGRCTLHAELGEGALAEVCRLYPRGVRTGEVYECSCANSCEAVVELLLNRTQPLAFRTLPLSFSVPKAPARQFHFETAGREQEIRLWLIAHIQDRSLPLPQRLIRMGQALYAMDQALTAHDPRRIENLLSGAEKPSAAVSFNVAETHLQFGLTAASRMLEIIDERSDSVRAYGEASLQYLGEEGQNFDRYLSACRRFERLIPQWEIWFEHMLANHMFFVQFPFQDRPVNLKDEFLALCAAYILLRFLSIGWVAQHEDISAAIDVAAAAFRLIDHTGFDRYAAPILRHLGCDDPVHLCEVLCL